MLERIGPGSLLIVPGDREDVIAATVRASEEAKVEADLSGRSTRRAGLAGLLLTGGYRPRSARR